MRHARKNLDLTDLLDHTVKFLRIVPKVPFYKPDLNSVTIAKIQRAVALYPAEPPDDATFATLWSVLQVFAADPAALDEDEGADEDVQAGDKERRGAHLCVRLDSVSEFQRSEFTRRAFVAVCL